MKAQINLHEKLDTIKWSSQGPSSSTSNSSGEKQSGIFGNKSDNGERVFQKLSHRRPEFLARFGLRRADAGEFRTNGISAGETENGVVEEVVGCNDVVRRGVEEVRDIAPRGGGFGVCACHKDKLDGDY